MTRRIGSPLIAALLASAVAGPLFAALLGLAAVYLQLPRPITIDPAVAGIAVLIAFPALFVGFALAFVPTLIGSMMLSAIADRDEHFRLPELWMVVGGLAGTGLAWLAGLRGGEPAIIFALVATSAICAGLCRCQFDWMDDGAQG